MPFEVLKGSAGTSEQCSGGWGADGSVERSFRFIGFGMIWCWTLGGHAMRAFLKYAVYTCIMYMHTLASGVCPITTFVFQRGPT